MYRNRAEQAPMIAPTGDLDAKAAALGFDCGAAGRGEGPPSEWRTAKPEGRRAPATRSRFADPPYPGGGVVSRRLFASSSCAAEKRTLRLGVYQKSHRRARGRLWAPPGFQVNRRGKTRFPEKPPGREATLAPNSRTRPSPTPACLSVEHLLNSRPLCDFTPFPTPAKGVTRTDMPIDAARIRHPDRLPIPRSTDPALLPPARPAAPESAALRPSATISSAPRNRRAVLPKSCPYPLRRAGPTGRKPLVNPFFSGIRHFA